MAGRGMRSAVVAAFAVVGVAACAASETDFKKAAEQLLASGEFTGDDSVTDVECDEPVSKQVGTTFWCHATVDRVAYDIPAEITAKDEVSVNAAQATPSAG